jgi:hypothetical protein
MYYILDIIQTPPIRIESLEFNTHEECVEWINNNGSIISHSIEEDKN